MEKKELRNKIKDFCENKQFTHPFIQECIYKFIEKHIELYGDVISQEELFTRLEDNLDKITFAGREKSPNGELGEYKGRIADNTDLNEIFIYFDEDNLDLSDTDKKMWNLYTESDKQKLLENVEQKKALIKSTILHELTHCAYTIKDRYGIGEKHIFSVTGKDLVTGEYRQIGGNNNNIEAIVNYISSRLEGKKPDEISTYQSETKAIFMLAEKIDEKSIVHSAWNSDEKQFKQAYINSIDKDSETGKQSYNKFQNIMKKLVILRNQNLSLLEKNTKGEKLLSELQQTLYGQTNELESNTFINTKHTITSKYDISIDTPKQESKLSFSLKIAKFLEKYQFLMNIPILKNFVNKQLYSLPPVENQEKNKVSTFNDIRNEFVNNISNNKELRKIEPLKTADKKDYSVVINNQISEEKEK